MANSEAANDHAEQTGMVDLALGSGKPLPPPPGQLDGVSDMNTPLARPLLRSQTSLVQSFQRPKKKVTWKGKSCLIGLPIEDGRGLERAPLLTSAEVQARLQKWEQEGYNTDGFILGDMVDDNSSRVGGQSRNIHPDPVEMVAERRNQGCKVSIPDRAEWDAWMEFIKEERLRALGVTTSDSEPPPSTRSPFSSTMSRASSQYPSLPFSPPQPPSSVGSSHLLQNSHMLSPYVNPLGGVSSQAPSTASPSLLLMGLPGPVHRYKQSVVYPQMEARMTFPPDHPVAQSTPPALRQQSPPHYFAQRQSSVSPAALGGMQSLGEALSPVSPFPSELYGGPSRSNDMLDETRRQQQDLQAQMLRQQQGQNTFNQSRAISGPHALSDTEKQFRPRVEIAHPTPRPHQRNHSEALQREIDEAETQLERESQENVNASEPNRNFSQNTPSNDEPLVEQTIFEPLRNLDAVPVRQDAEATDQSEIETNPSLRASPMPNGQIPPSSERPEQLAIKNELPENVGMAHQVKPSVSKLNVEAKEFRFDPKAGFLSSNFQFGSQAFQLAATAAQLNAAAPEFQPSKAIATQPTPSNFTFSSSTFNVDAPEFDPSRSIASHFGSSVASGSDDPSSATSKIFGKFNVNPSSNGTRRSSKALPIVQPATDASDLEERDKVEEDENGRPARSMARSKRARRGGSGGDQEAVYAPHSEEAFQSQKGANDEAQAASSVVDALPVSEDAEKQSSPDEWEPFSFKDEVDASIFNSARPPHSARPFTASSSSVELGDLVAAPRLATQRRNRHL